MWQEEEELPVLLPEVKELTTPPSGRSDDTLPGGHSQPKQAKIQHGELDMVTTSSELVTDSTQTMPNGDGAPILEGGEMWRKSPH